MGVTRQRIYQLRDQGILVAASGNRFALADVLRWLWDPTTGGPSDDATDGPDFQTAKRDLAVAQKAKIDLELAERRRELLPTEEVQLIYLQLAQLLVDGLTALPPRAGPVLVGVTDRAQAEAELDRECDLIRTSIARAVREFEAGYQPILQPRRAPAPDEPGPVGRPVPAD